MGDPEDDDISVSWVCRKMCIELISPCLLHLLLHAGCPRKLACQEKHFQQLAPAPTADRNSGSNMHPLQAQTMGKLTIAQTSIRVCAVYMLSHY